MAENVDVSLSFTFKTIGPPSTLTLLSVTIMFVNVEPPVFLTAKVYLIRSPTLVFPSLLASTYIPSLVIEIEGV